LTFLFRNSTRQAFLNADFRPFDVRTLNQMRLCFHHSCMAPARPFAGIDATIPSAFNGLRFFNNWVRIAVGFRHGRCAGCFLSWLIFALARVIGSLE
jgi:hypothetical protein